MNLKLVVFGRSFSIPLIARLFVRYRGAFEKTQGKYNSINARIRSSNAIILIILLFISCSVQRYPTAGTLISPLACTHRISRGFDPNRRHFGVDFVAKRGCPVLSVDNGTVIYAGNLRRYGKTVAIRHRNITTLYAHLDEIRVKRNQKVSQGELIGMVGNTGNATSHHLHFEIIENNYKNFLSSKRINPLKFLSRSF